ncbi:MAG: AAA family ATPase [Candidatus Micrarchaeota archaeon]|nr:AAA family ATPase [Candidatus Micrarchaeota archaeon]
MASQAGAGSGKNAPHTLADFSGGSSAIAAIKEWAGQWNSGRRPAPLLISGPTGTGKTFLAHLVAQEFGWGIFEFNASDFRNEEAVSTILAPAASTGSLFGERRLVLIDDADSLSGSADRGGSGAILKAMANATQPIILTARDPYDKKLQTIRTKCTPVELRRLHPSSIAALVKREALRAGIALPPGAPEEIAKSVHGDARAALNDLSARNFSSLRDREKNAFDLVRAIFQSQTYSEARKAAFASGIDHDLLKLWMAQNIPSECKTPFEISEAYLAISRADIFDGRISRSQHYGFLRYSGDLLSAGVSLARAGERSGYAPSSFPEYIRAMGASKSSRSLRASSLRKICRACHCSISHAAIYLPNIRLEIKAGNTGASGYFGFDEDETAFVSGAVAAPARKTAKKTAP